MGDKTKPKKGKKKVVIIVLVVLVVVAAIIGSSVKPGSNSSQYSRGGAGTEERFI